MAPRVTSELLLVGSLPTDSADSSLRAAAGFGRQPGPDGDQTMREHARVVRSILPPGRTSVL